jgi:hypothetical protein
MVTYMKFCETELKVFNTQVRPLPSTTYEVCKRTETYNPLPPTVKWVDGTVVPAFSFNFD